ncbi:Arabinose operon regulatory protein [Kluyvera cryocrescens]|uniref:Arabinose operon regulatory protein n=1 Tax=Kluyvera cryocrescens TaxID=580 RepID=A0A485BJ15_KLUCR|nr:Arabinose operon regulatory protein [Kluyvera cryocrescens]
MAEMQNDPLLPGYSFNAHLVAGLTPIEAGGYLDFFIDRPLGMKVLF